MPEIAESAMLSLLRRVDPERARGIALWALPLGLWSRVIHGEKAPDDPVLRVAALGRLFQNPIGLAAGLDKNATRPIPLMRLGFGSVEVGSVTPLPQFGNQRPRVFRMAEDRAVVNRMGMNSDGVERVRRRLANGRLANVGERPAVLGVNVAINRDDSFPERSYAALVAKLAPYADYVAINVSSPNTPGLRDLQAAPRLGAILAAVTAAVPKRPPILVKIAPDLSDDELAALVEAAIAGGAAGLIVGNTTTLRPPGLRSEAAREAGGLSGAPLYTLSTALLARAFVLARGRLTLIGCGGVSNGIEALGKIRAGASLVQVHTAFSYQGPSLIPRIKRELAAELRGEGFRSVAEAVGVDARRPHHAETIAHVA